MFALLPLLASVPTQRTKFAVLGIVEGQSSGVKPVIGVISKAKENPLFNQTKPWEKDINNGYPSVIYDRDGYRCWYDDHSSSALAYANSSDGIKWDKPDLGVVDLGGSVGKHNNIVVRGNGIGIYKDPFEDNASMAYKGFGGGTIVSADGIHWEGAHLYPFPNPPQRYDTSNNVFFDPDLQRYVATTRRHPTTSKTDGDRALAIVLSEKGKFWFNDTNVPTLIAQGTHDHQLYAQVTFKWQQLYMGIVMVYDATDKKYNRVHCRLAYSKQPLSGWTWVDEGGLTGRDFIPLGELGPPGSAQNKFDSYLCYASPPVHTPDGERLYYMGSNGPHSGSKPHRNASLGLATLRQDGYAGMGGSGNLTTQVLRVAGPHLSLTADVGSSSGSGSGSGSVRVGVRRPNSSAYEPGLAPADSVAVAGNVTDYALAFSSGATLGGLVGQRVVVDVLLDAAVVYTLGFLT